MSKFSFKNFLFLGVVFSFLVIMASCSDDKDDPKPVTQKATAKLSGDATITEGGSAELTVTLTGKSPWKFVYSDGTSDITVDGITSTTHKISVAPTATTTYTAKSVSDANGAGTASGTATITVEPVAGSVSETIMPKADGYLYAGEADTTFAKYASRRWLELRSAGGFARYAYVVFDLNDYKEDHSKGGKYELELNLIMNHYGTDSIKISAKGIDSYVDTVGLSWSNNLPDMSASPELAYAEIFNTEKRPRDATKDTNNDFSYLVPVQATSKLDLTDYIAKLNTDGKKQFTIVLESIKVDKTTADFFRFGSLESPKDTEAGDISPKLIFTGN